MKNVVYLFLLICAAPVFSFAQEKTPVGPVKDSVVKANEDTTLFSIPGYDEKTYGEMAHIFVDLRDLGMEDIVPRRVAWPKKDEQLKVIEIVPGTIGNQTLPFVKAHYNSQDGTSVDGYARADLFSILAGTEAAICPNCVLANACEANNVSVICQANLFKSLGADLKKFDQIFKSESERTAYFEKYKRCKRAGLHEKYVNEYRHYIAAASKSFQVPEGLLACLLFKENQWQTDVKSNKGAIGIAQIMPKTIDTISTTIRSLDLNPARIKLHEANKKKYENLALENLTRRKNGQQQIAIPRQVKKDYDFAINIIKKERLAQAWKVYIDTIVKMPTFKKYNPVKPWVDKYPTTFNRERAENPALAIGASALYLKEIIVIMEQDFPEGAIKGDGQLLNFLTAVSGVYNRGPDLLEKLSNPPPKTTDKWVEILAENNPEATMHMDSIKRCMEKGNTLPQRKISVVKKNGKTMKVVVDQGPCNDK